MNLDSPNNLLFSLRTTKKSKINGRPTLGKGGCGKVDLVYHISNKSRLFAMKTIPIHIENKIENIMSEIRLHQNLHHPNIIQIYGSDFSNQNVYIFLEYATQGDLFGALYEKNKKRLSFKNKLKVFYECVEAISYMHNQNILHRDLKPENILLDEHLNAKLCDFGWAIQVSTSRRRKSLCGTVEYMAPEIYKKKIQTEKTDIWALGILDFNFIKIFSNQIHFL
jgi:aurora kinase